MMKGKLIEHNSNIAKKENGTQNMLIKSNDGGKKKNLSEEESKDIMFSTLLKINSTNFDNLVGHLIATFDLNNAESIDSIFQIVNRVVSIRSNSYIYIAEFLACVYNLLNMDNADIFIEKIKILNPLLIGFISREGVLTTEQVICIYNSKKEMASCMPILDLIKRIFNPFYQEFCSNHEIEMHNWFTLYSLINSDDLALTVKFKVSEMLYPYRGKLHLLPMVACAALAGSKKLFMSYISSGVSLTSFDMHGSAVSSLAAAAVEGGNPDIVKEFVKAKVDVTPYMNNAAYGHHVQIFKFIISRVDKNYINNQETQKTIKNIAVQEGCPELESLFTK